MDFKSDVVSVVLVLFLIFVTWHFPSNCAPLLLLYLRIKRPHLQNFWTFEVLLALLAWWAVKIRLHVPLYCMYLQGLFATFVLLIIHFVCALFCVTIFPNFSWVLQSFQDKLKPKLMKNWGGGGTRCIMGKAKVVNGCPMLILNRAAKEHEWSDPRKWEKNQGQSQPRKRYVYL